MSGKYASEKHVALQAKPADIYRAAMSVISKCVSGTRTGGGYSTHDFTKVVDRIIDPDVGAPSLNDPCRFF